jgi:hypothetical protein
MQREIDKAIDFGVKYGMSPEKAMDAAERAGYVLRWERFTKRTGDHKLQWLMERLTVMGISHRLNGETRDAPILEVLENRLDEAWTLLPYWLDNIRDDAPLFRPKPCPECGELTYNFKYRKPAGLCVNCRRTRREDNADGSCGMALQVQEVKRIRVQKGKS